MDLPIIIEQLRAYAPMFAQRVAGAAEFKALDQKTSLATPCAFVVPLDDNPEDPQALNAVRQNLKEGFAVVVCLDNKVDERGQASATSTHFARKQLWKALLGWRPTDEHNGVYYDGGTLLSINRAQLWFQFEFAADMQIGPSDGWEEGALQALPPLQTVHINADIADPIFDRNVSPQGPDGRVEFQARIENLNSP